MSDQDAQLAWILALSAAAEASGVAETHGLVIGLLCARPDQSEDEVMRHLAALQVGDWDNDSVKEGLAPAVLALRTDLDAGDLRFRPLLPTDEQPLTDRTRCLAAWCSGFLTGFGAGEPSVSQEEGREALQMLEQIARAATDTESDQETEENAYSELVEFVRVAVLLLREDNSMTAP